jgi:hypothetical protein
VSDTATQLIRTFVTLVPAERHAVLVELARIAATEDGPLSDEELARAGDRIFAMYDAEEAEHGDAGER